MNFTKSKSILILFFASFFFLCAAHNASALTFSPVRFELRADSGQTIEKEMTLTNENDAPATYYVVFKNFEAEGESGIPSPTDSKDGLASWLYAEESVTVPARTSAQVAFQIRVPANAEPGGYFGMILWSVNPPQVVNSGQVAIGAQTGPLVLLTVNGDIKESGGVVEFNTKDKKKFYTALPVLFTYRFRNDGGDRVKPVGDMHIKNIFGMTRHSISANKVEGNVLPGSTRRFDVEWIGKGNKASTSAEKADMDDMGFFAQAGYEWRNFAFGKYKAELSISYGQKGEKSDETIVFFVVPWHLLSIIIISLLILFFFFRRFIRSYNRFIIRQATMALEQMEEMKDHRQAERSQPLAKRSYEEQPETLDLRAKKTPRRKI